MQRIHLFSLLVVGLCLCLTAAKPKEDNTRVHEGKLSKEQHFTASGEHNPEYDHDAFLGSEKKEFDHLSPSEAKERLGKLVDRIDKNKDGRLTKDELKEWIRFSSKRWLYDDGERLWKHFKRLETHILRTKGEKPNRSAVADPNAPLEWDLWKRDSFGDEVSESEEPTFRRDRKRWDYADLDNDDKLSKDEFPAFIHPQQFDRMKDLVVAESMLEMDTNKDGYISPSEYIVDALKRYKVDSEKEKDEYTKNERENFIHNLDKDKDGRLNMKELKEYVFPDYDDAGAEADHLIFHADKNKDGVLSKEEILENQSVFVGSSATEYGGAFKRHDEF